MKTSLTQIYESLWAKTTNSWDKINKLASPEVLVPKDIKDKQDAQKRADVVVVDKITPSGINSLVNKDDFLPKDEKDTGKMQLPDLQEIEEGLMGQDMGPTSAMAGFGLSPVALTPAGGYYDKNTCPDLPAPEDSGEFSGQGIGGRLVAPQLFVPSEGVVNKITEDADRNRSMRLSKYDR